MMDADFYVFRCRG